MDSDINELIFFDSHHPPDLERLSTGINELDF